MFEAERDEIRKLGINYDSTYESVRPHRNVTRVTYKIWD
jgi:hypothetical protein